MNRMIIALLVKSAFLGLSILPATAEPVTLKFAYSGSDTDTTYTFAVKNFADSVNNDPAAASVVKIDVFPNGALGRNMAQQAQMLVDGVADIAFVIPGITPGRFPDNSVISMPGTFADAREGTLAYTGLTVDGKLRGYEDYFVVGAITTAPFSVHTRSPVATLADLKGKSIRVGSPTEGEAISALGGVPVLMPVSDVAEAISRGTVDGATTNPETLIQFGISRVTNNHFFVRLGVAPLAVLMTKSRFDSLPPAAQEIVRKYSGEAFIANYIREIDPYYAGVIEELKKDSSRTVVMPTDEEHAAAAAAFKPAADAWVAQDAHNAALLADLNAKLAQIRSAK